MPVTLSPEVHKLALGGAKMMLISKLSGYSYDSIRKYYKDHKIPTPKSGPVLGSHRACKVNYDEALALRAQGISYAAIGAKYGVTKQCIQQTFKNHQPHKPDPKV